MEAKEAESHFDEVKQEHMRLASIIKDCHENLRLQSKLKGMPAAWEEHLQNSATLQEYAKAMHRLASIWETNTTNPTNFYARSRVKWIIDFCKTYFFTKQLFLDKRQREQRLQASYNDILKMDYTKESASTFSECVKVLDVGSCFNPFAGETNFAVTAIDLCPATEDVLRGDFLQITTDEDIDALIVEDGQVKCLPCAYFDCVIFSLLLEYIPSPEERLNCCRKAYVLLRSDGILIIITPDSQHVAKNAKIMKNWRYTLGTLGFYRICFQKLPHIACMVFRKSINPEVARKWAELHREDYMTIAMNIPQDKSL